MLFFIKNGKKYVQDLEILFKEGMIYYFVQYVKSILLILNS
jgi:hypothetical protein